MNVIKSITSSSREVATIALSEFDRAREVHNIDMIAGDRAWRRYFPVEFGKWDPDALKILTDEGRQPVQIDIASNRIETLVGSIIADMPDPTWIPVQGEKSLLTEAIAMKYHSDKDMFNYDDVIMKVIRDGFVHSGDLVVTEDWRFDQPGIRFERSLHGLLIWDPYWITDDDRDAEIYWKVAHLNPTRLKNKYGATCPELEEAIYEYKKDKSKYTNNPVEDKKDTTLGKVGDEFQVVEKHYLKEIKTKRLIGRKTDDNSWIPFPIKKEQAYLEAFADINGIDWETVEEVTYQDRIEYVTTVIRQLGMCVQEDEKGKIQVNGLSAHHFTSRRHMGRNMGVLESIADVEDLINKSESLAGDHIAMAAGGGLLVNENLFPDEEKFKKFKREKSRSGYAEKVPLDEVQKVFEHVTDGVSNVEIEKRIQRAMTQYLPLVSMVSESLMSMSASNEPGILFERKYQANMVANTISNRNVRQFLNNLAESYFYQYQITYDGIQIPVNERGGNKVAVVLNQKKNGQVLNWVGDTPRCRVVMAENTKSATYQTRWRSIWAEAVDSLSKTVQAAGGITIPYLLMAIKNLFGTIEVKEEDKDTVKVFDDMTMMIARLRLVAEASTNQTKIGQDNLANAQVDMQLQQIMQQLNSMQPALPVKQHEPVISKGIKYPEINPQQTAEAAPVGTTPPAQTGVPA